MQQRWTAALALCAALFAGGGGGTARAAACDEFNPLNPMRSADITLGPGDVVDADGDELRSFVATDSIGRVEVTVLSQLPRGVAAGVVAVPEVSRFSPYYGEALKGIAVSVQLADGKPRRPVKIVLRLRQVCARYFRNTFLYY
ncbi:MAG: hypothetical protein ACM3JG_03245 [Thiohalocapsa sp.]